MAKEAPMATALSSKGGCGKTTILQALASVLIASRKKVSVLDYDRNKSMFEWADEVRKSCPEARELLTRSYIPPGMSKQAMADVIREHREGFDFCLADLPGAADDRLIPTVSRSSIILVPLRHGGADLRCALESFKIGVKGYGVRKKGVMPPVRLVKTMTEPSYGVLRKSEAERKVDDAIKKSGLPCMETTLRRLSAFQLMSVDDVPLYALHKSSRRKAQPAIDTTVKLLKEINTTILEYRDAIRSEPEQKAA